MYVYVLVYTYEDVFVAFYSDEEDAPMHKEYPSCRKR